MNKIITQQLPAEKIKEILESATDGLDPMFELLRTMDTVFHFIRFLDINPDLKEAFETLRIQYEIYSSMVVVQRNPEED